MLFSIFLATIPLAIAGFNIIKICQRDVKKSVIGAEEMKAGMVVQRTEAFFEKITSGLLTLVNDEDFKMSGYSSHTKYHLENLLTHNDYVWKLALLDEKGNERIKVIRGWGAEVSRSRTEECGLDFFISKPFDLHQILNAVTQALESKEAGFLA